MVHPLLCSGGNWGVPLIQALKDGGMCIRRIRSHHLSPFQVWVRSVPARPVVRFAQRKGERERQRDPLPDGSLPKWP